MITLDQETGIVSEAGTVFDVEISRAKEGIKAAIKDGSMTREMIIDAVEGATKTIVAALKQLVEDKELIKYGGGKKNDPFMYSLSQPYPSQEQIPDQEENGCFPVLSIYPEQETGKTIIMLYLRETLRYQSRKGYSRKYV